MGAFSLAWPWALLALAAIPLLAVVWWWARRRRRRVVLRLPSVALIRQALPASSRWRRRIPVALFVAGLIALSAGVARPQASVAVPRSATSFILALDVSRSMCSSDVQPNRLTAAQQAARQFIRAQVPGTRIGIVAFAGNAQVLVAPTSDHEELLKSLRTLSTARGTAIGMAILAAIDAIAQINPAVAPTGEVADVPGPAGGDEGVGGDAGSTDGAGGIGADPSDGDYQPETIVVLTDGENTTGVDPVTAAGQAAARRLRVYTIGFGTRHPAAMVCSPDEVGGDGGFGGPFPGFGGGAGGGFGGGGRRFSLSINEETLGRVASLTGAKYFRAEDATQLNDVLLDLPTVVTVQRQTVELAVWFALVGAMLATAGIALSLWWNRGSPPRAPTLREP